MNTPILDSRIDSLYLEVKYIKRQPKSKRYNLNLKQDMLNRLRLWRKELREREDIATKVKRLVGNVQQLRKAFKPVSIEFQVGGHKSGIDGPEAVIPTNTKGHGGAISAIAGMKVYDIVKLQTINLEPFMKVILNSEDKYHLDSYLELTGKSIDFQIYSSSNVTSGTVLKFSCDY